MIKLLKKISGREKTPGSDQRKTGYYVVCTGANAGFRRPLVTATETLETEGWCAACRKGHPGRLAIQRSAAASFRNDSAHEGLTAAGPAAGCKQPENQTRSRKRVSVHRPAQDRDA